MALGVWGSGFPSGSHLGYTTDNKNLVNLFNRKLWSKRPTINRLLIHVLHIVADLDINFTVDWHERTAPDAQLADILSRNRPTLFQESAGPSHPGRSGRLITIPSSTLEGALSCRSS